MNELKSWDLPVYRKVLKYLGKGQNAIADKLVEWNNPAAFVPYFLTGGHDTAEALDRLAEEGFDRPNRYGQPSGNVRTATDLLTASQLGAYYAPVLVGGKLANKATKGALSLMKEPVKEGRRDFLKKTGALAGAGALSMNAPVLTKLAKSIADEPLLGKSVVDEVASVAPTIVKNLGFGEKLSMLGNLRDMGWFPYVTHNVMNAKNVDDIKSFIDTEDIIEEPASKMQSILNNYTPEHWTKVKELTDTMNNMSIKDAALKNGLSPDDLEFYIKNSSDPDYAVEFLDSGLSRHIKSSFDDWGNYNGSNLGDDYLQGPSARSDWKPFGTTKRPLTKDEERYADINDKLSIMVNDPGFKHLRKDDDQLLDEVIDDLLSGDMAAL